MTIRADVLEILCCLEAEGVHVSIDAGGVAVTGQHAAMSDRARVALATLEGRGPAVRRVLAEKTLSPEDRARVERQREALEAMRQGGEKGAAVRWGEKPEVETCPNGHPRNEANLYQRPGRGPECRVCRLARVRVWKAKRRARLKAEAAAMAATSPKRPGPPPRERCRRELHAFTPENTHTTPDGRRHCRECGRRREREKRNRLSAPTPTPLEATE